MTIETYKKIWGSNSKIAQKRKKSKEKKESLYDIKRRLAAS